MITWTSFDLEALFSWETFYLLISSLTERTNQNTIHKQQILIIESNKLWGALNHMHGLLLHYILMSVNCIIIVVVCNRGNVILSCALLKIHVDPVHAIYGGGGNWFYSTRVVLCKLRRMIHVAPSFDGFGSISWNSTWGFFFGFYSFHSFFRISNFFWPKYHWRDLNSLVHQNWYRISFTFTKSVEWVTEVPEM